MVGLWAIRFFFLGLQLPFPLSGPLLLLLLLSTKSACQKNFCLSNDFKVLFFFQETGPRSLRFRKICPSQASVRCSKQKRGAWSGNTKLISFSLPLQGPAPSRNRNRPLCELGLRPRQRPEGKGAPAAWAVRCSFAPHPPALKSFYFRAALKLQDNGGQILGQRLRPGLGSHPLLFLFFPTHYLKKEKERTKRERTKEPMNFLRIVTSLPQDLKSRLFTVSFEIILHSRKGSALICKHLPKGRQLLMEMWPFEGAQRWWAPGL